MSICFFKSSPGGSNLHPGLGATDEGAALWDLGPRIIHGI